jgi:hypothetical protein
MAKATSRVRRTATPKAKAPGPIRFGDYCAYLVLKATKEVRRRKPRRRK